jgi:hypothetical protein
MTLPGQKLPIILIPPKTELRGFSPQANCTDGATTFSEK